MFASDVVIIGAGPAGSSAASEIAKKGIKVLLIEKDSFPGQNNVCAGGIEGIYAQHLNLPTEVVEKNISESIYYFPSEEYVHKQPCISVQRNVFDRFLATKASNEGAELLPSTLVTDVSRDRNGLIVSLKNCVTGENSSTKTKLVIFADGPNTLAFKKFGIGFNARSNMLKSLSAIYELESHANSSESLEIFFDRDVSNWGYGWIFPKRDVVNVGVGCVVSSMQKNIRDYLDFLVYKHPLASVKLSGKAKLRFTAALIPLEHASKIHGDRMLVIGDAAGMVDSNWGSGIGHGIMGGTLAGEIAVRALEESKFNEAFLGQFEKEWKSGSSYKSIRRSQMLMKFALKYSKLDKKAFVKLYRLFVKKQGAQKVYPA